MNSDIIDYETSSIQEKEINTVYQLKCFQLQRSLRKTMKIILTDGRIVRGRLQCFDSALNLMFINAVEIMDDGERIHPIGRLFISECAIKHYHVCGCA